MKRQRGMRRDFQGKVILQMAVAEFFGGKSPSTIDYIVGWNLRRPGGNSKDRRKASRSWRRLVRLSPLYKSREV